MEKLRPYYFFSLSLVYIFLNACTEVNRSISSVDFQKEKKPSQLEEEASIMDAVISIFDEEPQPKPKGKFTPAYLDSASNNLFLIKIDTLKENAYGFKPDDLVSYPDSIYEQRISNISSEIDLTFNDQVGNFIDLYGVRKKSLTERMIGKSMLYFPFIEQALMEENLPLELKYLTMVESALQPDAQSSMEAVGLWQIRYNTGKWLGLEINNYLDERRDPYASTRIAIQYLKRLHDIYGSWPMALAAYNSGPGNVNKAIVRAGGSRDFWRIRDFLPSETRSYVPAFMALVYLNHFPQEHNIRPLYPELPYQSVDTVRVFHEVSFDELANDLDMRENEIAFLNPALIKHKIPSSREGWPLVLPMQKMAAFEDTNAALTRSYPVEKEVESTAQVLREVVPESDNLSLLEHEVIRGQNLIGISRHYDVSIEQLRQWNAMRDNVIRTGQLLKIYVPESQVAHY